MEVELGRPCVVESGKREDEEMHGWLDTCEPLRLLEETIQPSRRNDEC